MVGDVQIAFKQDDEAGSGGAEESMIEARVASLETDVATIRSILERLAPKIEEILLTGVRRADLEAYRAESRVETENLRGEVRETAAQIRGELRDTAAQIRGELRDVAAQVRGELRATTAEIRGETKAGLLDMHGDIRAMSARVTALPSVWMLLGIVFTTWGIGSGIVFTIARMAK